MQQQQAQQQAQYPGYQTTPTDGMYGMGGAEQHVNMGGMGDLNAWNNTQPTYPASNIGYGHANVAQPPRQSQTQPYRQHMAAYGTQQDPQKMQYPSQPGMMSGMQIPQQVNQCKTKFYYYYYN